MTVKTITCPIEDPNELRELNAGDQVALSGRLLTARDAAHQALHQLLQDGRPLPVNLKGQVLYYVGPAPAPPGLPIGSAGPTTASRMDVYTPELLDQGIVATIGKGQRSSAVKSALIAHGAVYFGAVGGIGALLARHIRSATPVAFEDLGPEAMYELEVDHFPVIVLVDCSGGDLYELGPSAYRTRL